MTAPRPIRSARGCAPTLNATPKRWSDRALGRGRARPRRLAASGRLVDGSGARASEGLRALVCGSPVRSSPHPPGFGHVGRFWFEVKWDERSEEAPAGVPTPDSARPPNIVQLEDVVEADEDGAVAELGGSARALRTGFGFACRPAAAARRLTATPPRRRSTTFAITPAPTRSSCAVSASSLGSSRSTTRTASPTIRINEHQDYPCGGRIRLLAPVT
jgi:hypothetical protein